MKKFQILVVILVVVIIALMAITYNSHVKYERLLNQYKTEQTSWMNELSRLKISYNEKDQQVVKTEVMRLDFENLKSLYSSQSKILRELQLAVKKNTQAVIQYASTTADTVYVPVDSIYFSSTDTSCNPVYYGSLSDEWGTHKIIASRDTMMLDYTVFNDFSFTENWEPINKNKLIPRFLKKKQLELKVVNLNPHTKTRGAASWRAPDSKKRRIPFLVTGYLAGILTSVYLLNR